MTDFIKARPTKYAGIQMRSRLEADFARSLDEDGLDWKYEPECYAGPAGQWLPDFSYTTDRLMLIEVKPASFLDKEFDSRDPIDRVDELLRRMEMAWLSEPAAGLVLECWPFGSYEGAHRIMASGGTRTWIFDSVRVPGILLWPGMGQLQAVHAARRPGGGER